MQRTNIYLDDDQVDLLRRIAGERGTPMSVLIREAIDSWLAAQGARPIGPDEWERRFDALMGRRRAIAEQGGFDPDVVEVDVLKEIRAARRGRGVRPARRR
jgi:predicted transcriptional regulator